MDSHKHFLNIVNWKLVHCDFDRLEYDNDDCSSYYEFDMEWMVNGKIVTTHIEVAHSWVEGGDEGDYWTPPSFEVVHEDIDIYVISIWDEDGNEYDLNNREIHKLAGDLEQDIDRLLF